MEEKAPLQNNNNQEIDLWDVFKKLGAWIRQTVEWFYDVFLFAFVFLIRKSLWLVGFIILGCVLAFFMHKTMKPYYNSNMQLRANVMDNAFFVNMINDLSGARDLDALTQKLNLPDTSMAKDILSITACFGVDLNKDGIVDMVDITNKYIRGDSAKASQVVPGYFYINASVYSDKVLPYIKKGIMNIIENNVYVKRYNDDRFVRVNEAVATLTTQINLLDSLQKVDYFDRERRQSIKAGAGPLMVLSEKDQKLYHADILTLTEQRRALESSLILDPNPVTLVKDFSEMQSPVKSFVSYAKPIVSTVLLAGLAFLIIWDNRKKIFQLINEKR